MTDIEKKALALWGPGVTAEVNLHNFSILGTAFLEMRERHEAFRQEVSDAVVAAKAYYEVPMYDLSAFIINKPVDPLVETFADLGFTDFTDGIADFREAIAKRGGKIVWGDD